MKQKKKDDENKEIEAEQQVSTPPQVTPLPANTSIGAYLQEARVKAGLTINQVTQQTKIHIHYLEAIERDDFNSTPPFIYVRAYIKKLCALYNLSEGAVLLLLENYETEREPLPEKLLQNLEGTKQVNKGDVEKVRSYAKLIGMSAVSFIVLLVILGAVLMSRKDRDIVDKPLAAEERTQLLNNMAELVSPQKIDMNELKPLSKNN